MQEGVKMDFEAIITAKRLKHAVSVLQRVNDESVFKVADNLFVSRVVDPGNSIMVQVTIGEYAGDYCIAPDAHRVGIDLDKMTSILKRATMTDNIHIYEDEKVWSFTRGIHNRSLHLVDIARMRKCQPWYKVSPTTIIRVTGKEFKDIMSEAEDVSEHMEFQASSAGMVFDTTRGEKDEETYTARLSENRVEFCQNSQGGAKAWYSLDYLQDIAVDMKASDAVTIEFADDLPCVIKYTRDAVDVQIMLAPRIESD